MSEVEVIYNVQRNRDGDLELLPDWAKGLNITDELVEGLQLYTKDGRRTGNAHIVEVDLNHTYVNTGITVDLYTIITDAGNYICMTTEELHSAFYLGRSPVLHSADE